MIYELWSFDPSDCDSDVSGVAFLFALEEPLDNSDNPRNLKMSQFYFVGDFHAANYAVVVLSARRDVSVRRAGLFSAPGTTGRQDRRDGIRRGAVDHRRRQRAHREFRIHCRE